MSSLPSSWVEKLFTRFAAAWGAQKVGSMFPADSHAAVQALWAEQLGRFEPNTLRHALQAAIDSGREWPPALPEFIAICQRSALERRAHAPCPMLPLPTASPDVVERELQAAAGAVTARRTGTAWADKILARHASGERVSIAVLGMAQRAKGRLDTQEGA